MLEGDGMKPWPAERVISRKETSEAPPRTGEHVPPVVGFASLEQCLIARALRGRRRLDGAKHE